MGGANGLKQTAQVAAPVASITLSVNVVTAPSKALAGERIFRTTECDLKMENNNDK